MVLIKGILKQNKFAERRDTMPRKILIVEDLDFQSKLYFIVFSNYADFELFFTSNRVETMDLMDLQKDIELIISDINMPMM